MIIHVSLSVTIKQACNITAAVLRCPSLDEGAAES